MTEGYESTLMGFPLFEGYTEAGARSLIGQGEVVSMEDGQVLFEEGDDPDSVVLILDGHVEVYVERDGQERVFSRMGAGVMIGEMAVLCETPRAASVRVAGSATVLQWSSRGFRRLLLRDAMLARNVFRAALKTVMEHQQKLIDELAGG